MGMWIGHLGIFLTRQDKLSFSVRNRIRAVVIPLRWGWCLVLRERSNSSPTMVSWPSRYNGFGLPVKDRVI